MTGELGLHGDVKPVGGIIAKIEAAKLAGAQTVIIPKENEQALLKDFDGITIIAVDHLDDVLAVALEEEKKHQEIVPASVDIHPTVTSV